MNKILMTEPFVLKHLNIRAPTPIQCREMANQASALRIA